jgi:hypothetical protein
MHTIKQRPVVVDGQIVIRPIMVVALTYVPTSCEITHGRMKILMPGLNFADTITDYWTDPMP